MNIIELSEQTFNKKIVINSKSLDEQLEIFANDLLENPLKTHLLIESIETYNPQDYATPATRKQKTNKKKQKSTRPKGKQWIQDINKEILSCLCPYNFMRMKWNKDTNEKDKIKSRPSIKARENKINLNGNALSKLTITDLYEAHTTKGIIRNTVCNSFFPNSVFWIIFIDIDGNTLEESKQAFDYLSKYLPLHYSTSMRGKGITATILLKRNGLYGSDINAACDDLNTFIQPLASEFNLKEIVVRGQSPIYQQNRFTKEWTITEDGSLQNLPPDLFNDWADLKANAISFADLTQFKFMKLPFNHKIKLMEAISKPDPIICLDNRSCSLIKEKHIQAFKSEGFKAVSRQLFKLPVMKKAFAQFREDHGRLITIEIFTEYVFNYYFLLLMKDKRKNDSLSTRFIKSSYNRFKEIGLFNKYFDSQILMTIRNALEDAGLIDWSSNQFYLPTFKLNENDELIKDQNGLALEYELSYKLGLIIEDTIATNNLESLLKHLASISERSEIGVRPENMGSIMNLIDPRAKEKQDQHRLEYEKLKLLGLAA